MAGSWNRTSEEALAIGRRAVFFIGGYEHNTPRRFFARMEKELPRFTSTWGVEARITPPVHDETIRASTVTVRASDGGREVETDFHFLSLDDIVDADHSRPFVSRLGAYFVSVLDYVVSGTIGRFFAANWRFALYFLFPAVMLGLFFGVGMAAGMAWLGAGFAGGPVAAVAVGVAVTFALGQFLGERYFVFHLMDLWNFSRQYARGRRTDMDVRLDTWRAVVADAARTGRYDEILLVGHSTGGALILDLASRVADGKHKFTVLTVGSTSLKIGLHPAAGEFRARVASMAGDRSVRWFEYQALTDVINFYKCDPYALMGLRHDREDAFPAIRAVRFRNMLDSAFYARMKRNFFRVHYQFISANTKRYFYDFYMICFGAIALPDRFGGKVLPFGPATEKERADSE